MRESTQRADTYVVSPELRGNGKGWGSKEQQEEQEHESGTSRERTPQGPGRPRVSINSFPIIPSSLSRRGKPHPADQEREDSLYEAEGVKARG